MTQRTPLDMPLLRKSWIDAEYTDESANPKVRETRIGTLVVCLDEGRILQIRNGVKMGEGDGTVNLISLGAMCVEGWKRQRWNPAGINVTVVEVGSYTPSISIIILNDTSTTLLQPCTPIIHLCYTPIAITASSSACSIYAPWWSEYF